MIRKTLARPALVEGTGLFTGLRVRLTLKPGNHGLRFIVERDSESGFASAHIDQLSDSPPIPNWPTGTKARNTTLRDGDFAVTTTEHVLSALVGLGVTDADITLDGPEPPIMDGSALPFAKAVTDAGLVELDEEVEPVRVSRPIEVTDEAGASITAEPADRLGFIYHLDHGPGAPIEPQVARWDGSPGSYLAEIAPARTFCLEAEARALRDAGLFGHVTPRDLLVIGPDGPIDNAWRFEAEPAAHKLLDLVGDLALVGRPMVARITARRSGHALNHALARAIVRQSSR